MNQVSYEEKITNSLNRLIVPINLALQTTTKDNFRLLSSSRLKISKQTVNNVEKFDVDILRELSPAMITHIQILMGKLNRYFASQKIEYKITQSLQVDPEYEDFSMIRIGIKISKDLDFIFKNLKKPIYDIINESIPTELEDKILIKLEKL